MYRDFLFSTTMLLAYSGAADVPPGDNFFAYANAEWLETGEGTARTEITHRTAKQLAEVISDGPAGKVTDFHNAYLDDARIEKMGIAPIAPLLKSIDGLSDKAALSRWLGSHLRADVDPLNLGTFTSQHLFGFAASFGIHGEPNYIAYLTQGGVSHTDRIRIAQLLKGAGVDRADERADAVLALEHAIALTHASDEASGNERNADNHWRRVDFTKNAPGIDWPAFFSAAGLSKVDDIVAWQPDAIKGTAALVASQPLPVWKDYLRFHVVLRYAEVLPPSIVGPSDKPRWQRAIDATSAALPDAVGRLYVERYFPAATKARVQTILDNVVAAFRQRVAAATWMTPATKATALSKLDVMYFGVGYPDRWPDDSKLRIDAHDAVGNLQRIAEWNYRNAVAKLGRSIDRHEWAIAPQWPGGVLNFQLNTYNFSAALLQPPRFDPDASDAENYGSIGAIFAHEVSHFVDTLGAEYDAKGDTRKWWTAEDRAGFDAACRPLVDQFSAYRPFPDLAVDGQRTLVENVADLGGVATAFDAYRKALGSAHDREFFIGFARSWRSKLHEAAVRARIKGDGHAPDEYHVDTVRNLDAWYEAFDVRPGQRLYLAPEARVRIW